MEKKSDGKPKNKKAKIKVFTKKTNTKEPENVVIEKLKSQYESIDTTKLSKFSDLPLSQKTLKGLRESKYFKLTDIQKESIGLALQGKDILGAAQTGSGKTLAFLIPILERLYCEQWTRIDGLGALVITPTRELAYQIFETLRKVGRFHDFSAGLVIGGKDLKFERKRMDQCNIVICTPGRLLQHMDENPLFDCVTMKVLVLDEADRCLDMGFKQTLDAIVANLPPKRQTLLFSATQTKSVQDLARLSLKDPSYVSVNEMCTPKELKQSYVICELHDKISIIWSFIKNHTKQKIIVFLSTCKQVKYVYEMFCKLRPGLSLMALYGTLHQLRRMKIYEEFCRKQSAVLFATDLAARGLDFPAVHWVVQADCPEDVETYIHRVGRTARYHRGGESILLLMPSELKMVEYFEEKKIPVEKIDINPNKFQDPIRKMQAFISKDPTLKDTAQRAFSHYARSVFFMKHKEIFNVNALNFELFSESLGLSVPPRIRFLERMNKKQQQMMQHGNKFSNNKNNKIYFGDEDNQEEKTIQKPGRTSESDSQSEDDVSQELTSSSVRFDISDDSDEDCDMFGNKRINHDVDNMDMPAPTENKILSLGIRNKKEKPLTKAAMVKQMLKKKIVLNKKIVFDDEGAPLIQGVREKKSDLAREYENENTAGIDIEKAPLQLREEDKFDRGIFKEKVKAKHKEEKRKLKQKKKNIEDSEDDFGESGDEPETDLSWLPDPDKIYGKKEESADENVGDGESSTKKDSRSESEEEEIVQKTKHKKTKKRKHSEAVEDKKKSSKHKKKQKIEELSADLDVNETEELAIMLLKGKR